MKKNVGLKDLTELMQVVDEELNKISDIIDDAVVSGLYDYLWTATKVSNPDAPEGLYLVTTVYKGDPDEKYVEICEWENGEWHVDDGFTVEAWMEVPDPYVC